MNVFSFAGDLSTEDPVHGVVHRTDAEPLSQSTAVVLGVHALWGCHSGPVEAGGGHKGSGGCGTSCIDSILLFTYSILWSM